jgi:large subunit ribosomal protein L15
MGSLSIFDNGAEVTPDSLQKNGLVSRGQVRVKILGGGTCTKKLTVKAHAFSTSAKAGIEAVGGTCVTL